MPAFEVIKNQFALSESEQADHLKDLSGITNTGSSYFSFKPEDKEDKCSLLNIVPESFRKYISLSSTTGYNDYNDFLNYVPSIEIREFGVKNTASYIASWMDWAKEGYDMAMKSDSILSDAGNALKNAYNTAKVMFSAAGVKALINAIGDAVGEVPDSILGNQLGGLYLTTVPFALYYGLTTTKTNAYYRLPMMSDKFKLESDGHYGWSKSGNLFDGLGTIGNFIAQTFKIRCDITPQFKPDGNSNSPNIDIELDLINDTLDSAKNNTKFVYSLIGKNRWLQHGIIQSSASLYDIKLPSGIRYFMCSGAFTCDAKGSMRYIDGFHTIGKNENILIPDAYTLKLSFKSLLPDNFNTFFWSFSAKNSMKTINGSSSIQDDIFVAVSDHFKKAKTEMAGRNILENKESIIKKGNTDVNGKFDDLNTARGKLDKAREKASMSADQVRSELEEPKRKLQDELNEKESKRQKIQSEKQQLQDIKDKVDHEITSTKTKLADFPKDQSLSPEDRARKLCLEDKLTEQSNTYSKSIRMKDKEEDAFTRKIDDLHTEISQMQEITDEAVNSQMEKYAKNEIDARDDFITKTNDYYDAVKKEEKK